MIALHMLEVRDCMSKLLLSDIFDAFLFIEGDITTFNTFHLDGYLKKDFFDTEEALSRFSSREYSLWKEVRTLCYTIIKGKKTPLGFKFVFCLSGENTSRLLVQEGLSFSPSSKGKRHRSDLNLFSAFRAKILLVFLYRKDFHFLLKMSAGFT